MKITEKFMGFQILLLQFRDALYSESPESIYFTYTALNYWPPFVLLYQQGAFSDSVPRGM